MAEKRKLDQDSSVSAGQFWLEEIARAEASFETWVERGERVVDRYRDDRSYKTKTKRQFNILWSNVQVLKPALYGRMPKAEVSRRWDDKDPVGKVSSTILERSLNYEIEHYQDFSAAMSGAVEDRLLPGRGTVWQRYEMGEVGQEETGQISEDLLSRIAYECAPSDYVNWKDFLHNPARTWDEVWWVARRVYLSKDEGVKRFGPIFNTVPVQDKEKGADKETPKDALKSKTQVWEIWNKNEKTVIWVANGFRKVLDERPDPLQLEGFFPCPKPLYATMTTGSLIPVPDYCEYQDQAEELDVISQRIHLLTKALKARGVYNAEYKEVKRILSETEDNELIAVSSWAAFAEKGGLKGAMDWLPIDIIAGVLEKLNVQRQECLTVIYQTMGLSDIMRGSTDANETLGAQKLKANFGSLRLRESQGDTATFATSLLRLKAQVMCRFFSPDTLIEMSGIAQTPEAQDPNFPQILEQAIALLKNGPLRGFRISIESDTLAQIDEQAEKEEGGECLTAIGAILKDAMPMVQAAPTMLPAVGETLLAVMRKFRLGRSVELAWEQSLEATQQFISQGQGIPPEIQEQIQAKEQEIQKAGQEVQKGMQEVEAGKQELQKKAIELDKRGRDMEVKNFQREQQLSLQEFRQQTMEQVAEYKDQYEEAKRTLEQESFSRETESKGRELILEVKKLLSDADLNSRQMYADASNEAKAEQAKRAGEEKKQSEDKSEKRVEQANEKAVAMNREVVKTIGDKLAQLMELMAKDKEIVRDPKTGRAQGVRVAA